MKYWMGKASYRWIILCACMLVYCTSQLVRWNYASITKYLMTDLAIGKPELGLLGSAFFYAYAVRKFPGERRRTCTAGGASFRSGFRFYHCF